MRAWQPWRVADPYGFCPFGISAFRVMSERRRNTQYGFLRGLF